MQRYNDVVLDTSGNIVPTASITVTDTNNAAVVVYSDNGTTIKTQPFTPNSLGEFFFYAADGKYNVYVAFGGRVYIRNDVELYDIVAGYTNATLLGTPTAPTAPPGTNTLQIANTAYVTAANVVVTNTITAATVAGYIAKTSNTGSAILPSGTTAQQDISPASGYTRINTTLSQVESYISGTWQGLVGLSNNLIKFTNVAATFTSFFRNVNTASRTYLFPDRDITVAGLDDISGVVTSTTKLPSLTITQATGALTFAAASIYLDFRSTTLTSGTVSTVLCSPSNLVLPSGGTLGAVTTVQARIIVVELNNAGTAELAVINLSGGNDLSETGVINTTAISAASTANNVFYSTAARTGVSYRVVGAIDAVNTTGAWGNPILVQGAGGRAITNQILTIPAVATTSGSSIDFTGIPSWAKEITLNFIGVSTNGTSTMTVRLGTIGGVESTGYLHAASQLGVGTNNSTTGFDCYSTASASINHGQYMFSMVSANTWTMTGNLGFSNTGSQQVVAGSKVVSGILDRIRLTTANGTDLFDAGAVSLLIKG